MVSDEFMGRWQRGCSRRLTRRSKRLEPSALYQASRKPVRDQRSCWIPVAPGAPSDLSKSTEIWLPKIAILSASYEIRTKSTQSRGLEKDGRRERLLGLRRGAAVAELCTRRPVFIGDFCALAGRQRIFGGDRLAEGDEPESNMLRAVENDFSCWCHGPKPSWRGCHRVS